MAKIHRISREAICVCAECLQTNPPPNQTKVTERKEKKKIRNIKNTSHR